MTDEEIISDHYRYLIVCITAPNKLTWTTDDNGRTYYHEEYGRLTVPNKSYKEDYKLIVQWLQPFIGERRWKQQERGIYVMQGVRDEGRTDEDIVNYTRKFHAEFEAFKKKKQEEKKLNYE